MHCHNGIPSVLNPLVRLATSLALALLLGTPAFAVDSGDIVVSAVKGEVRVTMNGAVHDVRVGSVLELPASVRTGRDGSIDLEQGATSISVGPDTELEFPALEKRGAPVDRIVQPRGNAFYDIGKREGRKLRVETPYLVGVIKGTQFNVAAQQDATTISLFEGRLEVRASDDSDVVDLQAGEIASRRRGDKSISVIKMNEKPPATAPRSQNQGGGNGGDDDGKPVALSSRNEARDDARDDSIQNTPAPRPVVNVDGAAVEATSRDVSVGATVNRASVAVAGVDAAVDVGNGVRVDVSVSAGVDVTPAVSADVGTNVSVDVGGSGASVDTGAATDLGAGAITTSIDTAAAVDLGSNGVGVSVDAGVAAGVGDVAAADTGVDLGAGAIDLGVTLGNLDVDLGVDLGLDTDTATDTATTTNTDTAPPGNIVDDVGGLLDGLLRRPGSR